MLSRHEPGRSEFLTVNQVADLLRMSRGSVRRRIAAGELDVVRVGTGPRAPIRIASGDLADYLERATRG